MEVIVNGEPLTLLPGMTVRHALLRAGLFDLLRKGGRVFDDLGNEVGLDGELADGSKIFFRLEGR